jgi:tight adherence protein B
MPGHATSGPGLVSLTALLTGAVVAALVTASGGATGPVHRRPAARSVSGARQGISRASAVRLLERARPQHRPRRRDAQLPDALERLASAVRGGQALGPALRELAVTVPDPLGADLRPIAAAIDQGEPVARALAGWAEHPAASPDVRLVVGALAMGAQAGGEVARAVDRVAATLRERREVQGEVRALATQARTSAGVLAVAPLGFAVLVSTIEPGAVAFLVASPLGLVCLVVGLGLEALGGVWMARISRSAT